MRKFLTISLLAAIIILSTIATSNTAKAQPASFTADFLQEDYRGDEVVRTNTVTVVWDASTEQLTFNNFYKNTDIVNSSSAVVNLPINYGVSVTSLTWESDTKASFTWRVAYLGKTTKFSWTGYQHALVSRMIYYQQGVTTIYNQRVYYTYAGGTDCHGTIDLEKGEITIDNPWGCVIAQGTNWYTPSSSRVVEYFERSKMTIIKTDLVDIVNDGTVGEEYTVTDDLVGVTTVDGVLNTPMRVSSGNQNAFLIDKGRYKLDLDLNNKTLTVSPSAEEITGYVDNGSYPTYYVLGQANNNDWNPTVGQPMETTDGVHYSAVVNFDGRSDGRNTFSLTSDLAQNNDQGGWNYVNGQCRLGPEINNFPVTGEVLFAKDMGKFKNPSVVSEGQIDFLGQVEAEYQGITKKQPVADFDQSNWVMLTGLSYPGNYVRKIIKAKTITGRLVDKLNPTIAVTSTPEVGDDNPYEPNIYIMPSFNEAYYENTSDYFFVAPKAQEYAFVTWACFNGDDNNFYVMSDGNTSNLTGGIKVNWDYYPAGEPQPGYVYQFDAILRKVSTRTITAPTLKEEGGNQSTPVTGALSADYLVYPLRLYDVPTAIKSVEAGVKYYNLMGVESPSPFKGVNIVVSTMDNGTRTATKKIY